MKILHSHIWLASGGVEAMVVGLCNEMSKRNEVTFLSIFEPKPSDVFGQRLSKKVKTASCHKKETGFDLRTLWRVYKWMKENEYDVIHLHGHFYYFILPVILLHNRVKFIYTLHSAAKEENSVWDIKLYRLKRFCFRKKWMQAVTISKASKRSFLEYYGFDNSILIYNGTPCPIISPIDISRYRITENTRILLHAARITEAKNQLMLCQNCQRLIDEGYDMVLLIAGPNKDDAIMQSLQPFFSERIVYLGERNDVTDIMNAVDGFCLSSIWEGMPVTLIEALAVGCVPVCTPVGGIPEAIEDGASGFLSQSTSKEDYYVALKRFLDMPEGQLSAMREKAKAAYADFDITTTAKKYEQLYNNEHNNSNT